MTYVLGMARLYPKLTPSIFHPVSKRLLELREVPISHSTGFVRPLSALAMLSVAGSRLD